MKSATPVRRVVLIIMGVLIVLGVVAFSLRTGDPKIAVAAPAIPSKPANPASGTSATSSFSGTTEPTFQITGTVSGLTLGVWKPIRVTIVNPNAVLVHVRALTVAVSADSYPSGCGSSANVELQQSNISRSLMVTVPANGSVVLPAQGSAAPRIRLKNLPTVNQDVCKNKSFNLSYTGTAAS